MRIMVTGGAGFVGSALVRLAVMAGHEVLNFDALTASASLAEIWDLEENHNYRLIPGDICAAGEVADAIDEFQPEAFIHLAAETDHMSGGGARDLVKTNVNGTFEVLEALRSYCDGPRAPANFRFLQLDEDLARPGMDATAFGATKQAANIFARTWADNHDIPMIQAASSASFGPRQFPENLVPATILLALQGREIPVMSGPGSVQDWIFVRDQADALLWAATKGEVGQSYRFSGGEVMPTRSIATQLCRLLQVKHPQAGLSYTSLITNIRDTALAGPADQMTATNPEGWTPSYSFEDGLSITVDWFLQNEVWWRPLVERGLGETGFTPQEAVA